METRTFVTTCLLLMLTVPAVAADSVDVRLGVRGAGNYNILQAPGDAAGEPTLLSGAGFKGFGGGAGLAGMVFLTQTSFGHLYTALDLLFVAQNATGKAEAPATDQRREVTLDTRILHAPLHLGVMSKGRSTSYRVSVGPELMLGLGSGATVTQENIADAPQPLYTTPVTHIGVSANVGVDLNYDDWIVPFDVRFVLDPSVPASTRERFDNYESNADPGNYQVAFDYQFFVTVGLDRLMRLSK